MTPTNKGDNSATELEKFIRQNRKICWEAEFQDGEFCIGENKVRRFVELLLRNQPAPAHPETPAKDESGLLPCPFCGNSDIKHITHNKYHDLARCKKCEVTLERNIWQQRTAAPDAEGVEKTEHEKYVFASQIIHKMRAGSWSIPTKSNSEIEFLIAFAEKYAAGYQISKKI